MKKMNPFEKSPKDKEIRGMKEGSKKEMALDRKQAKGKMPPFLKGKK
jgi:hypothetical protein